MNKPFFLLKQWLAEASVRRLIGALLLSLLAHWLLINGLPNFLPKGSPAGTQIEVNLVGKQAGKNEAKAQKIPAKKIAEKKSTPKKQAKPKPPAPTDAPVEKPLDEAPPEVKPPEVTEAPAEPIAENPQPAPAEEMPISEPLSQGAELATGVASEGKQSKLRYLSVLTSFDVFRNGSSSKVGEATITYQMLDEKTYQILWEIHATGALALLYPKLTQTSTGELVDYGLQPKEYIYDFGGRAEKTARASFDWDNHELTLKNAKGETKTPLVERAQDTLSFMYQFMFVAPLESMEIPITNGKKLDYYTYGFSGEVPLKLSFGDINTYHIVRAVGAGQEKTELWLAIDYGFIPIKIKKTEKDGSVTEQIATKIATQPLATRVTPQIKNQPAESASPAPLNP